jgi:hypothetical protein
MKARINLKLFALLCSILFSAACTEERITIQKNDDSKNVKVVYGSTLNNQSANGRIAGNTRNGFVNRDNQGGLSFFRFAESTGVSLASNVGNGFNFANYFSSDWNGDSRNDLICRTSWGSLFFYPWANSTFIGNNGGVNVGNGFNFSAYLIADWNGDGTTDLIGMDSFGTLRFYPFRNSTFFGNGGGNIVGRGFNNFTHFFVADWNADGTADLIARDNAGTLRFYPFRNNTFIGNGGGVICGTGFNFTEYFIGEFDRDNLPELMVRQSSGPILRYSMPFAFDCLRFSGNSNSCVFFQLGQVIGFAVNIVTSFIGDWSGDGLSDYITLDTSGFLNYYKFRESNRQLEPPRFFVANWNFNNYFAGNY